nr:reverse transcriptase domain-containing protein [Tanacetum cinerariifolium]
MVRALLLDKKNQSSAPAPSPTPTPVKAVKPNCVTCSGAHSYQNCPTTSENVYRDNIQDYVSQAAAANYNQGNTGFQPQMVENQIRPLGFPPPPVVQYDTQTLVYEPVVAPVSAPMPNLKPSIPYPSRRDNERRRDQANEQIKKFYEIFKDMSFKISNTDALILMPKFTSTLKALIGNKEKLSEMARTPMNEHCSAVILNKLPRKLGDPEKFLIPCDFLGMDECLALADLADFVVVDFEPGPRVPLILGRCFLKTSRALIDVHKGELTLRIGNKATTYNLDQTVRYSANYNQMTANKINVIDMACEVYSQEVLGFSNVTASGNPTPYDDLIVSTTSPTLTPFGDSDFLLFVEADAFLAILNSEPLPPLPNHEQYMPLFKKELKVCEAKTVKSSIDEPLEVELKDLPPHLEYAFQEGDNKLPVIIAKELGDEEKSALIKVLRSHKRAIAWKLSDIQGINPKFCTHKILMEEDYKPTVSPVHCVPKKGGFTIFENEENELIPTRLVTGWRTMEVFMDDFSVLGNSFENCLSRLDKMLQRWEDTHLCLNWEKSHFMVKEGIVLGHKISKNGIEVDKAKVDVSAKLPHLTTVKGENHASWLDKLDDALWAFRTAYKTPIGCTPYKLVYGKSCHLPIELEHKAYWALKQANFDLAVAGDQRKVQLNELNELHDHAYANSLIYKEKTKRIYDSKIKNLVFNVGDRVLLFNSRLKIFSGKLKTRWSGPFTTAKVFPYDTVELSQANGSNFKVNGHRVKHYFRGDVPQLVVSDLQTFPMDN